MDVTNSHQPLILYLWMFKVSDFFLYEWCDSLTLYLFSIIYISVIMAQIEIAVPILWVHKPILAIFSIWVPSSLLMKSFVRTTCAQGLDEQNSDCKVDGLHTQPGKRHPAGAKWHFNTRHILRIWLSTQTVGSAMTQRIGSLEDSEKQTNQRD